MAIKARDQVTISIGVDVASVDTYYKLQASTAAVPQKPTTASPSGWSTTEPGYDGTATNTLYTCQKTTLTDGTFYWGAVSKSSSYEAAKQAANGVNSLSQTVTTLSNNYATFKQETETFESTVGTTYAKKVEIDELVSRGEQLVINGNLFMGDTTNFSSSFIFDGSMANGTKGSVTQLPSSAAIVISMVDYFPIDANGDYYCSLDVIREAGSKKAFMYAYLDYRDVDKNTINYQHWHSMKTNGDTLTQLAQDLKSGDTKIYVNDVSKYVANSGAGTGNQLIVWDWVNSFGYAWPPNTYSRHFAGSWTRNDSSVFNLSENSITLTSAYSGVTIPAGTWVSQRQDGGTYQCFCYGWVPDTWTTWGHIVGASYTDGGGYTIPCSAAEARVGFLWNHTTGGATASQAQMWATNISVTKMGAIDNKLGTEISQRKAQFGICTTAAGTAAKVVTLADFSLYTGAQIAVRFNNGNTVGSPTLNVNSTGARQIVVNGTATPAAKYVAWNTYANCTFVYDGTYWRFTGSDQDMVKTVDVESRVSTAETSITQNRNNIALKANASDVYTKTQTDGLISTEVTNRNSAIEQSAAAINLSVSQTYTTKTEFNNLEIGGRNLIRWSETPQYAGYQQAKSSDSIGWYSWNNNASVVNTSDGIKCIFTGNITGLVIPLIYDNAVLGDETLAISFDYRGTITMLGSIYLLTRSGGNVIQVGSLPSLTSSETDWVHFEHIFKFSSLGDRGATHSILLPYTSSNGKWFEIKNRSFKLEKGNKTTDWTPAPEDAEAYTDTKIDAAKAEIKVTTDGISSTVSKISSIKYVTAAASSWPLASIKTYAAEGHSESWGVNSTDGLRVGDTVYVKGTDGTRNCTVYIKTTVTSISSTTIFTGVSHGYEDVLPVDTIKSTINQSSDSVKIQANHVEIDGAAIFSNTAFRQAADNAYDAKGTATNAINNLEIGGRNLLLDTANMSNNKTSGTGLSFSDGILTWETTSTAWPYFSLTKNFISLNEIDTSKTLTLSVDIRKTTNFTANIYIGLCTVSSSGAPRIRYTTASAGLISGSVQFDLSTEWVRYYAVFSADYLNWALQSGGSDSNAVGLIGYMYHNSTGTIQVRKPKLEYGNVVTDWTPAPEDVDAAISSVEDSIPTKVSDLTNDSNFQTSSQVETIAQGYANTAKSQAIAASYANMGFQFKKDIIIYGDSDKYYPVYLNNTQAEYSQSVPHEVVVTRGYSEQAPADWNTSTHKGGLNLRLCWNYGGWGGATYVCQIYDFSELYSKMLGDVLVGNKSGMNSTIYLRGGGTTGAIYHIYSEVSIENTRYGTAFPYIGTDEPGTVYMQSGSYTFTVDNPLTTPNTAHILSLAATVDEQYIYISKASGTTSVASTTTWVTAYTDSQNAWTTKRPTYDSSYPVLFVAKQRKTAFGLVTCTTPVKDDTTTVIDGGHITTGTIDTNRLNADTIKSNIVQTTDIQASRVMMMSGEQTQSLEAYRESVSNNIGEMVSNETFQQKIQALDEALEEKLSQEDVDTIVNTAISDVEESIANNYVANADLDDAVRTLNDTLSNLGMTYATTEALSELSESLNITSQDLVQLTSYIYADNVDDGEGGTIPVLFLGSKQSKVQAMLSNNVLNFIYRASADDPGTVVAYIGAEETDTNATGKLYVIEAVVVNEISFGHWSFFERQNHNMAIKWIGE